MKMCEQILVVEDSLDIRESIVDALSSEGYKVESAQNGKEAIKKLKTMPVPTLVLLDLMMPTMNGWEFLDRQKRDEAFSEHKIVVVSAVAPTESLNDATLLEIDGSLQKPIYLEKLWAEVKKFCGPANTSMVAASS